MLSPVPVATLENGLIRCYNMFPSYFKNIDDMTAYLPALNKLGINVVWINPVQLAGQTVTEKADMITGQNQDYKGSIYAMADPTLIDPRFSVVARDADGDMALTQEQQRFLESTGLNILETINRCKKLSAKVAATQFEIDKREKDYHKNIKMLGQNAEDKSAKYENIRTTNVNIKMKLDAYYVELEKLNQEYVKYQQTQRECIQLLDGLAMQKFTLTAKKLGMTPIFDLVFNHVSNDAALVHERAEFFNFDDKTFPDATAFTYSKLLGSRRNVESLSDEERASIVEQIPTIIEHVWRPFIQQYVREWGFCGARVDCVRKVPKELRAQVYGLIRQEVERQEHPMPVVIMEETLFSDLSPEEFLQKVGGANATHNMGSTYYKERLWHGGLPEDPSFEDFFKKSMVEFGVVNFSGNHDHYSCAMTVCRELARERLEENAELFEAYRNFIGEKENLSDAGKELLKSFFFHHYVKEIIAELHNPDFFNAQINRFGIHFRDKFLTSVFCGSGGYFMMSGDEFASFKTPSVFVRPNGEAVHPNKQLQIFLTHKDLCERVLHRMAESAILGRKYKDMYAKLDSPNKAIILSAIKEQLRNEINANIINTKERFVFQLKKTFKAEHLAWSENLLDEVEFEDSYKNGWQAPQALEAFANPEFYAHVNKILSKLPASKTHFWSELFKTLDNEILIAVRVNGYGYAAQTDVVIYNLNPHKTVSFSMQDLEKISQWFQQRGFPTCSEDVLANPDYHRAKGCILGSSEHRQVPANLYFGGYFSLEKEIENHHVNIDNVAHGFQVCVSPQVRRDPLSLQMPELFVPESTSSNVLLQMFNRFKISEEASSSLKLSGEIRSSVPESASSSKSQSFGW